MPLSITFSTIYLLVLALSCIDELQVFLWLLIYYAPLLVDFCYNEIDFKLYFFDNIHTDVIEAFNYISKISRRLTPYKTIRYYLKPDIPHRTSVK